MTTPFIDIESSQLYHGNIDSFTPGSLVVIKKSRKSISSYQQIYVFEKGSFFYHGKYDQTTGPGIVVSCMPFAVWYNKFTTKNEIASQGKFPVFCVYPNTIGWSNNYALSE